MNFDWKMFIGTFFLIFLAELGDKTQLTALARSATGGKWPVFIAASLALVCSTLIAVLFGSVLKKYVPEFFIKLVAGILFLIFGGLTLFSAIKEKNMDFDETPKQVFNLEIKRGKPALWVMQLAAYFEDTAAKDYRDLAEKTSGNLQKLFLVLANEEEEHLSLLKTGIEKPLSPDKQFSRLFHDVAEDLIQDIKTEQKVERGVDINERRQLIEHAIRHEQSTADFYLELAKSVKIPGLKRNFKNLAAGEQDHIQRLQNLRESIGS